MQPTYDSLLIATNVDRAGSERQAWKKERMEIGRRLGIAGIFTAPLLLLGMIPMMIPSVEVRLMEIVPMQRLSCFFCALASVVQFGPGLRFYRTGFAAVRNGSRDMNTPTTHRRSHRPMSLLRSAPEPISQSRLRM
jgi:Cu+-exporting ATPase